MLLFQKVKVVMGCLLGLAGILLATGLLITRTMWKSSFFVSLSFSTSKNHEVAVIFPVLRSTSERPKLHNSPANCTDSLLGIIESYLPPDECNKDPWLQKCSLTKETKCPEATWLEDYYRNDFDLTYFLGISVGCNKAFDAVEAIRRGSANPIFDKSKWKQALQAASGGDVQKGVCNQDAGPQYSISLSTRKRDSELHCIEPMPLTVAALQNASRSLHYNEHGLVISHAAISRYSGVAYFPTASLSKESSMQLKVGAENQGIDNCRNSNANGKCQEVPMYSLDEYTERYIGPGKDERPIQILSIDVEGYDFDVLLGGMNTTLPRVEYLEFEYNWMGSWAQQSLREAVHHLDRLGFTCYWAGRKQLWRITGCFLDHYETKHWSNVACVSRRRVPNLSRRMEDLFMQTVGQTG